MGPKKKSGKDDSKEGESEHLVKVEADLLTLRRLLELKTYEVRYVLQQSCAKSAHGINTSASAAT